MFGRARIVVRGLNITYDAAVAEIDEGGNR